MSNCTSIFILILLYLGIFSFSYIHSTFISTFMFILNSLLLSLHLFYLYVSSFLLLTFPFLYVYLYFLIYFNL